MMFIFCLSFHRGTMFSLLLSYYLLSSTTAGFTPPLRYCSRCSSHHHDGPIAQKKNSLGFIIANAQQNDNENENKENDSSSFDDLVEPQPIDMEMFQQPAFLGIEPTGKYSDPEEVPVFTGVVILLASLFFTFGVFFSDETQGDAADLIFNTVIQKV
mmetsp:Transcript_14257/g.17197  ORF Transcript_14257/g.17197 Transcript_14257/m.17197 type:complete len:157 (+) Transcript_14257:104-574(+)